MGTKFYRVRCRPCAFPPTASPKAKDESEKDSGYTPEVDSQVAEGGAAGGLAGATDLEASVYMGLPEPKSWALKKG